VVLVAAIGLHQVFIPAYIFHLLIQQYPVQVSFGGIAAGGIVVYKSGKAAVVSGYIV
jgi:hypothetical protein